MSMGMAVCVLGEPRCWWCPWHHLAQGLETMGRASVGLCSHPTGMGQGDFVPPPHSHFEAEVLLWLRDMVSVLEKGAALSAGVSVPPAMLRLAQGSGDADHEESHAGRAASLALGLDAAEPIGAPCCCCQEPSMSFGVAHGLIPGGTGTPLLALALHVTAQGSARQTGPFHSPKTLGSFITGSLPRSAMGSWQPSWHGEGAAGRGGRSGHKADVFAGCCEQCCGSLAALSRGEVYLSPSCLFPPTEGLE